MLSLTDIMCRKPVSGMFVLWGNSTDLGFVRNALKATFTALCSPCTWTWLLPYAPIPASPPLVLTAWLSLSAATHSLDTRDYIWPITLSKVAAAMLLSCNSSTQIIIHNQRNKRRNLEKLRHLLFLSLISFQCWGLNPWLCAC